MKLIKTYIATLTALVLSYPSIAAETLLLTPHLQGMDNFRDVAGTTAAYATSQGGEMRQGVFYRSNALTPTASDLNVLNGLRINKVIDLRTDDEIAKIPDTLPSGARYIHVDIIGTASSGAINSTLAGMTPEDINSMMEQVERDFVTSDYSRQGFGQVLREMASAENAALFHCTAGKDRTGWTAALLQSIAGVDRSTIFEDYLATNDYTAERISATLAALPPALQPSYAQLMSVQASWLQAGFDQITQSYGSLDNYLKQGLGLDQATIYALRGKMVRYRQLPSESSLSGNGASGASLLNALQDSPLSGRYTQYNYYLQSAIDRGTLGGVEKRVGGQVHADAQSYLLRQISQIDDTIAPWAVGDRLLPGESTVWLSQINGYMGTDGSKAQNSSTEHTTGILIGGTHRFNERISANAGVGYGYGSISSAGGNVKTDSVYMTFGVRAALSDLQQGPYSALQGNVGYVDYQSTRSLGEGLGTAKGDSRGELLGARASVGWLLTQGGVTLDPRLGVQVSHLNLNGFRERGSELALDINGVSETQTRLVSGLEAKIPDWLISEWSIRPSINVGYERRLSCSNAVSHGEIYEWEIEQSSALNDRNMYKAGVSLSAKRRNFTAGVSVKAIAAGRESAGVVGTLSAGFSF